VADLLGRLAFVLFAGEFNQYKDHLYDIQGGCCVQLNSACLCKLEYSNTSHAICEMLLYIYNTYYFENVIIMSTLKNIYFEHQKRRN